MSNINATEVLKFPVVLPPLTEQKRIAEVLDRAEALRTKRRAAIAQLDTLTESIFLDLFGDPLSNSRGWQKLKLIDVLSIPLRNGLSPSTAGTVNAKVLTLSAVTGEAFDETAVKTSKFISRPPDAQSVSDQDLLICRGNGNIRLVGKGYFPRRTMSDVTFPDTIIAARISPLQLHKAFLECIWNTNVVRRQIESLARTTNGTFKVNQGALEGIEFIAPPPSAQLEFAKRLAPVDKIKVTMRASLTELDALFASLQHRAFRGEL